MKVLNFVFVLSTAFFAGITASFEIWGFTVASITLLIGLALYEIEAAVRPKE